MALHRIRGAKVVILNLLKQSYVRRDQVAIVGFRGTSAEAYLPPTRSILRARRVLESLRIGGGTPLAAGLRLFTEAGENSVRQGWRDICSSIH